jgi:glycine/D-amino acid oxidase-like deaminating enzyme
VTAQLDCEVVVVGGGLVGAALAYGLRALGSRLVVVDEGDRAFRAARGNFGLIWVQGKGTGLAAYGSWTQRAAREWPKLAADLEQQTGIDVGLRQRGGFHLCLAPQELDARVAQLNALMAQPGFEKYALEVLDHREVAKRVPRIGPAVAGATYCAHDGDCNPLRLLRALHAAIARAGCRYVPDARVELIEAGGNGFTLRTRGVRLRSKRVVLAAGLGNARLAPMIGLAAPVRPNKGHVLVLERLPAFLPLTIETVRQTDDGTVLVGDSQQEAGFDESLDAAVLAAIAKRAIAAFPLLGDAHVIRAWAALRVMSPDGFPIYAESARHPGAFVVTCHSGVTLAAQHAHVLAPALGAGRLPDECRIYSHERFDVRAAA